MTEQTEALIERLKDDSEKERRSAIKELGRLGDPVAMQPLISVLQDENEDRWVRSDAAEALGSIRDERALEALIIALKDENLYHGAAKGLGRMGDKRAIEPLKALLQDNAIKLVAGKAIGRIEVALGLIPGDWDYCENCGKAGAKLYQGGSYAFCSDSCRGEFGAKLSGGGNLQVHCPFCGTRQNTETGMSRGVRICIKCRGNMDVLLEKA